MSLARKEFRRVRGGVIRIQRLFRHHKLRLFFMDVKKQLRLRAALLLQKYLRGYLVYNRYYAHLKGTMTRKNLDYIITKYADAKEYMRECMQIKLAYLTRRMIKRKAIERERKHKAAIAEKKRLARLKEIEKAKKLHEERKQKKRDVRAMLKEAVELLYAKEEKRRAEVFKKA